MKKILEHPLIIIFSIYSFAVVVFLISNIISITKSPSFIRDSTVPDLSSKKLDLLSNTLSQREKLDYQGEKIDLTVYNFGKKEPFNAQSEPLSTPSAQER